MGTQRTKLDNIQGKTALVTGAAGSIGAAITRFLAEDCVRVAAVDMDAQKLQDVIGDFEGDIRPYTMDVSKEAEVASVMEQVRKDIGDIDILVNVAGILSNNKLLETSADEWHKIHAVNLDGPFFLSKEVLGTDCEHCVLRVEIRRQNLWNRLFLVESRDCRSDLRHCQAVGRIWRHRKRHCPGLCDVAHGDRAADGRTAPENDVGNSGPAVLRAGRNCQLRALSGITHVGLHHRRNH